MEATNADSDFKKFGSEGVKWLWEKEVGLGEACLLACMLLVCL